MLLGGMCGRCDPAVAGLRTMSTLPPPGRQGAGTVQVTFYGVRGSTPFPNDDNQRYGGNTSCAIIEAPYHEPIVLDLVTGLRMWGEQYPADETFNGPALVTTVHLDHVQGLPFSPSVLRPGDTVKV